MSTVAGIDIAKATFDIATLHPNGKYHTKGKLTNNDSGFEALRVWLGKHTEPDAWIVMEATGVYHEPLAEYLYERGYRVCVVNPACIKKYGESRLQRVKTDKIDSKLIALYGVTHLGQLKAWKPVAPAYRRLRALVRRLEDLQEMVQMERNRVGVSEASVRPLVQAMIAQIEQQIAETLKAIKQHIDDDPDLRNKRDLLVSIQGISDRTASLLLAEQGDPLQYKDGRALVAFAGLNPKLQESGKHRGHVTISRMGSARLRAGLYMPAVTALTYNPAITALKKRLEAKGKAGKQIVCAAMRKLLHIAYGVLKSGQPFDARLAIAR
ncbi:IS110 family transposase [Pseudomonas knackmussii]|uniref:IS110 family transposase n=1 Tax=Pseudomonas knackmussii TaxID=65741 RepID=A0ABY4KRK7_9PSED|nr:IS110 family transposase [Pseudomonas knackmussii]UPQ83487.1 IS110 family transposase [Pseudomonas knackmussii]